MALTLKGDQHFQNTMFFSISRPTPLKLKIPPMLLTGVIIGVRTLKDETKSNALANQKVRSITNSVADECIDLMTILG